MEYCSPVKIIYNELHTKNGQMKEFQGSLHMWLASRNTGRLEESTSERDAQICDARVARPR